MPKSHTPAIPQHTLMLAVLPGLEIALDYHLRAAQELQAQIDAIAAAVQSMRGKLSVPYVNGDGTARRVRPRKQEAEEAEVVVPKPVRRKALPAPAVVKQPKPKKKKLSPKQAAALIAAAARMRSAKLVKQLETEGREWVDRETAAAASMLSTKQVENLGTHRRIDYRKTSNGRREYNVQSLIAWRNRSKPTTQKETEGDHTS